VAIIRTEIDVAELIFQSLLIDFFVLICG